MNQQATHRRILANCTFHENEVIKYVFARHNYRNKLPTHFNLYTDDEEFLVLSATGGLSSSKFVITTNSREIDEKSQFFVGNVFRASECVFDGKALCNISENEVAILYVAKVVWLKNKDPVFTIPKVNGPTLSNYDTDVNTAITLKVEECDLTPEKYSISFSYNGKTAMTLQYKEEDQYSVMVTYPLSLFQAFTFCLAFLSREKLL